MQALGASDMLALWEQGRQRHALDRTALLCAWALPDVPATEIPDLPLGEVNESLIRLRSASFGARIEGRVDCERCGEALEVVLDAQGLLQKAVGGGRRGSVDAAGRRMRPPSLRDLAAVAGGHDEAAAARHLLERCCEDGQDAAQSLPIEALREVDDALEVVDRLAELRLAVHCDACGHDGSADLDIGSLLWEEIAGQARALLLEVHLLARAYGWSEQQILALGAARRATYLDLVAP